MLSSPLLTKYSSTIKIRRRFQKKGKQNSVALNRESSSSFHVFRWNSTLMNFFICTRMSETSFIICHDSFTFIILLLWTKIKSNFSIALMWTRCIGSIQNVSIISIGNVSKRDDPAWYWTWFLIVKRIISSHHSINPWMCDSSPFPGYVDNIVTLCFKFSTSIYVTRFEII
jgi:hypothetical protein